MEIKLGQKVNMSFDVPHDKKKIAQQTVNLFNKLHIKISLLNTHLNHLYEPFSNANNISQEVIQKYRDPLWNYAKSVRDDFIEIKDISKKCYEYLANFDTDGHVIELMKSFSDSIGDIDDAVSIVFRVISNWDSDKYKDYVIQSIDTLKKEISQTKKLIYERIISYINENILDKTWIDDIGELNLPDQDPKIVKLKKERDKQLESIATVVVDF